jgi:23S rRNA (adenine1618-N6)-methyltransferase
MTENSLRLPTEKTGLHPRNKHRGRYDFDQLIQASPALASFVRLNAYHDASIDFASSQAVKALNQALLKQFYNISDWDIPAQYLCPPIPGRADYLHYLADLLAATNGGLIPQGDAIRVFDIGVGANAIYPLLGHREYGWHFVGADIDPIALENAQKILAANTDLSGSIELRLQTSPSAIFKGIVAKDETFDLTICNPPFHSSLHDARVGTQRKWQNLGKSNLQTKDVQLNFGGQGAELYCTGGEEGFISRMVSESKEIASQCLWFTTLISKASSLPCVYRALKNVNALQVKTIDMAQGQKKSRLVAWTFLNASQQRAWYLKKGASVNRYSATK